MVSNIGSLEVTVKPRVDVENLSAGLYACTELSMEECDRIAQELVDNGVVQAGLTSDERSIIETTVRAGFNEAFKAGAESEKIRAK